MQFKQPSTSIPPSEPPHVARTCYQPMSVRGRGIWGEHSNFKRTSSGRTPVFQRVIFIFFYFETWAYEKGIPTATHGKSGGNTGLQQTNVPDIYGGPEVQIHPLYGYILLLHDPQFLHSTVTFVHSTAKFLHSTPQILSLHCKIPSLDAPDSFTPLQNSFTRRPQILSLHCKIPSLDAPDSFTPLQKFFTRRPQFPSLHCKIPSLDAPRFLHSTAKFLRSTIPCVSVISVPCLRRKSQLPSDGHSSDPLRALACVMYVFRWEMLAPLIGMGIIGL